MLSIFYVSSQIMANMSESFPFSFLNSYLGFAGGKHYQKIIIPIFRLVFQNVLFQVTFLILFSVAIFFPYFLLVGLLLQFVALFQSRKVVQHLESL